MYAVGAVEMWESGCLVPDFQAQWKGWETRSLSFPRFPGGGISTAPARGVRSAATQAASNADAMPVSTRGLSGSEATPVIVPCHAFCASTRRAARGDGRY